MAQIHELIGRAMGKIGAIGKDTKNQQQGFMYRGIDAVYNALNPVMAELGLFIAPEVIDQKREERVNKQGTVLTYTILTIKYTIYAPDGSNISLTVVGEGMDSGDKSTNKAMSIAMKYAMFQLFFIPTEELKDPDADVYTDIKPRDAKPSTPSAASRPITPTNVKQPTQAAEVAVEKKLPPVVQIPVQKKEPEANPVVQFLLTAMRGMREKRGITPAKNNKLFKEQHEVLIKAKLAPAKKLEEYTMDEAVALVEAMDKCFDLTGTELKTE